MNLDDIINSLKGKKPEKWIIENVEKLYNELKDDEQFKDEDELYRYILLLLKSEDAKRPQKEYNIIPIGLRDVRITKSDKHQSVIYAIIQGEKGISRIVCFDEKSGVPDDIWLFSAYKTKMGRLKDGSFVLNEISEPRPIDQKPDEIIEKLEIPITTIRDVSENLSKRNVDGYVIDTDWRCIKDCIVLRINSGKREDGTFWAVMTAYDSSLNGSYDPLTVWIPKKFSTITEKSLVDIYGSLQKKRDSEEYEMNCNLVIPKIIRR